MLAILIFAFLVLAAASFLYKGNRPEVDGLIYVKKQEGIDIGTFYPVKVTNTAEYDLVGEVDWKKHKSWGRLT